MPIPLDKKTVRQNLKISRAQYAQKYGNHAPDFCSIFKKFIQNQHLDLTQICVGLYIPMGDEASPASIMDYLIHQGVHVALPVMASPRTSTNPHASIEFMSYTSTAPLLKNSFGFLQPQRGDDARANPSLLIMPLLGVDDEGYRIGYGKGHYDRYLHEHASHPPYTVGLAFSCQSIARIPRESHDKKLNAVLFPDAYTLFS